MKYLIFEKSSGIFISQITKIEEPFDSILVSDSSGHLGKIVPVRIGNILIQLYPSKCNEIEYYLDNDGNIIEKYKDYPPDKYSPIINLVVPFTNNKLDWNIPVIIEAPSDTDMQLYAELVKSEYEVTER